MAALDIPRKVEDPLEALRRSVDAHRQATQAAIDTGRQLQDEQQQDEPTPERPA